MGEYAGELPRKFNGFHCLDNESNELKESNTKETQIFPDLRRRSESEMECISDESPEKRLADLKSMPVCETRKESIEGVVVPNLPIVVESLQDVSHDESQIIESLLLGESMDVLDDSRLPQLIENFLVEFGTELEGERSESAVKGVSVGQYTENLTFLDNVMDLKTVN